MCWTIQQIKTNSFILRISMLTLCAKCILQLEIVLFQMQVNFANTMYVRVIQVCSMQNIMQLKFNVPRRLVILAPPMCKLLLVASHFAPIFQLSRLPCIQSAAQPFSLLSFGDAPNKSLHRLLAPHHFPFHPHSSTPYMHPWNETRSFLSRQTIILTNIPFFRNGENEKTQI